MDQTASRISLILTGVILLAAAVALATFHRPDDCRPSEVLRPHAAMATAANAPTPTLAPPQQFVLVHVEADKPDIEVGWAEN